MNFDENENELPVLFEVKRYSEDLYDYGSYKRDVIEVVPPDRRGQYGEWKPVLSSGRDVPGSRNTPGYFELTVIWRAKPLRPR